jgi:hypothetical protein
MSVSSVDQTCDAFRDDNTPSRVGFAAEDQTIGIITRRVLAHRDPTAGQSDSAAPPCP